MARYNVDLQDNEGNAYQIMANPDSVAEFSPAANRENIRSGETYRVIFGKIMKYLSEVGNAAYVGLANNCTTTIAGFALDARQGKELMDRINELNRDFGGLSFGQDANGNWGYKIGGADPVIPFKPDLQSVDVSYKDIIKAGSSKNYNVKEHPHLIIIQASTGTSAGTEESNNWLAYSDGTYGMEFLLTRGNGAPIDIHVVDGLITITAVNLNVSLHDLYYM